MGWTADDGLQWAELDSDWFGPSSSISYEPSDIIIYQDLPTVPGGVYELSFAYSPRPGAPDNVLKVYWGGELVATISATSEELSWTTYTTTVTASGSTTRLQFEEDGTPDSLGMLLDDVSVILLCVSVDIDIKPGSDPNSICLSDQGLLPVAILGSETFDVRDVNASTINIGGISLTMRGSVKKPKLAYSFEDVNGDGYIDLIAFFDVQELINAGILTEDTIALKLDGNLYDGTPITGTDSVRVVPP